MHKNKKHTNRAQVFPPRYFSALLFSSSLFLCLLSSLKIISLFLSAYPSSYYSLPKFSRLPPSVFISLWIPPLPTLAPSWLFFLSNHHPLFLPLSSAPSFFFSCSIPHIPVGFLRGRTPLADQGQTLLQCSQPLFLFLSPYFSSSLTDSTSPFTSSYSLSDYLLILLSHSVFLSPFHFPSLLHFFSPKSPN